MRKRKTESEMVTDEGVWHSQTVLEHKQNQEGVKPSTADMVNMKSGLQSKKLHRTNTVKVKEPEGKPVACCFHTGRRRLRFTVCNLSLNFHQEGGVRPSIIVVYISQLHIYKNICLHQT